MNLLRRILSQVVEEDKQENEYEIGQTKGVYRASSIGKCGRAIQYAKLDYSPEKKSPESLILLKDGEFHETSVRNLYQKLGPVTHINKPLSKKYKHKGQVFVITGHTDFVFEKTVHDVKGINTFTFKYIDKNYPQEFSHYVDQIMVYQDILGIKKGILDFKDKNTSQLNPKEANFDKDYFLTVLDRIAELHKRIKSKELIDRPYDASAWQCRYCEFRIPCRQMPMESKKWQ